MTEREKQILSLIKKQPMLSQKEIAESLGITRSSAGVHIGNLMKKGFILGKGYLLPHEEDYVCVVGGANMDLQGVPEKEFHLRDSNPGQLHLSLGGVGRNIAENLCLMDVHVKLLTAIGNDVYGNKIISHANELGMDTSGVLTLDYLQTSTYLSILDANRDMHVAIADMAIMEHVTPDYIKDQKSLIEHSKVCVLDTNIPQNTLEYILNNNKDTVFFIDTVSTAKASKIKDLLGYFHTLKPNIYEVEMLTGIFPKTDEELRKAADYILEKGVEQVFITMGEKGVFYANKDSKGKITIPPVTVVNATGAGDAFTAALVKSHLFGLSIKETALYATAASLLALSDENTINPNINDMTIKKKMEELTC